MEFERERVIIVDDDITNLIVAKNSVDEKYDVFTAPSSAKLFQILEKVTPDIILLDIEMPGENGYEVIDALKKSEKTAAIPVIFLTSKIDPEDEVRGLTLGAVDYVTKPFSPELLVKRIDLHLLLQKQKKELLKYNHGMEEEIDRKTKTVFELQNAILKTVAELVECRDTVTGGHIERTQHYLGQLLGFLLEHSVYTEEISSWDINLLVMSSQLHDVGKISIRDGILLKPGKLTDDEFNEMKKHCTFGVDIIERIEKNMTESEFLTYAKILAATHHEKWNGSGYPLGLKGDDIPLQGRLMALVDVYDALTNDRPYKKALSHEESVEIIKSEAGSHFDPLVTEVFLMHEKEFSLVPETGQALAGSDQADYLYPTLNLVANIVEMRGGQNRGRAEKIRHYLKILTDSLLAHGNYGREVAGWNIDLFLMSAQLHDAGKMVVPDQILNKSGKLTDAEFEEAKAHTNFGVKIIRQIKENVNNGSLLRHAETLAGSHHEKWDGTGYPLGLKGREIPLQGRLMAIVDVYSALTSERPHRGRVSHEEAVAIIKNNSGTQFDPELVEIFLVCEKEFKRMDSI